MTNAAISTVATTHVARDNVDDDDNVKTMPTTSIVLGESKVDGAKHSNSNYLGDILHSARWESCINLGFSYPNAQLRPWAVKSFCMEINKRTLSTSGGVVYKEDGNKQIGFTAKHLG